MAREPAKAHLCSATTDLRWRYSMSDFVPALGLYLVTAAISIILALNWVG